MKALKVTLGELEQVIALDHPGVLNAIVNCVDTPNGNDYVELSMGGLDCTTDTHQRWKSHFLEVGDSVTIQVIEDCKGDSPTETEPRNEIVEEERRRQYIRDEAAKLGWGIDEKKQAEQVVAPDGE